MAISLRITSENGTESFCLACGKVFLGNKHLMSPDVLVCNQNACKNDEDVYLKGVAEENSILIKECKGVKCAGRIALTPGLRISIGNSIFFGSVHVALVQSNLPMNISEGFANINAKTLVHAQRNASKRKKKPKKNVIFVSLIVVSISLFLSFCIL